MAKKQDKEKEKEIVISNNKETINLKEFMLLDAKKQDQEIEDVLNKVYEGNVKITKKHIDKILNIAFDTKDNDVYLPNNLHVQKEGSKLIFSFRKSNAIGLFILFSLAFLFLGGFATYTGVQYLGKQQMNKDLNGDGIADLNIDLNDDGICDINCDTDKDGRPDKNIDYKGNRKAIFNVLREDGSITNPINQDLDNDGKCDINCDTNNDGWPDINIDIDGDGKVDLAIDVDGDNKPDINIDTNGDGKADVNIDLNDDGKCDKNCIASSTQSGKGELNIDLNNDGICDINCDTDEDGIPDINIDHGGNKTPIFNVDNGNNQLTNRVNQDTNRDGICDINCDIDEDGWPDTNIDLDGDGKADLNIDSNKDGVPDLNIDKDGDGVCDMNCDEDNDGKCDKYCAVIVTGDNSGGGSSTIGNGGIDYNAASLIIVFESADSVNANKIYPDDQPGIDTSVPDLKFTIENTTDEIMYYNIDWVDIVNTFESNNFWFKVSSNYNGYNADWKTAPFTNGRLVENISIAPNTIQSYTISFTLHGTGEEQNYDQGKTFKGKVSIELIED